jgi:hypothetical protein
MNEEQGEKHPVPRTQLGHGAGQEQERKSIVGQMRAKFFLHFGVNAIFEASE